MEMTMQKLTDLIKEQVGEAVAAVREESQERSKKDGVKSIGEALEKSSVSGTPTAKEIAGREPGQLVVRALRSLIQARKSHDPLDAASNYAMETWGDETLAKSLTAGEAVDGGILIRDAVSDDLIELTRPRAVVSALGGRDVPLPDGQLTIPAHTAGAAGGWIGEGEDIPTTQPKLGAKKMSAKTYGALVPISMRLIRRASRSADQFVITDLRNDIAQAHDTAWLRGSGANGQPKGLRFKGVATQSLGTALDNVLNDLVGPITRMGEADLAMGTLGIGLSFRSWQYLWLLRGTDDHFLFQDEMNGGTLMGHRFRTSSKIKNNYDPYASGTANKTELYFMDMDEVLIGRGEGVLIDTSGTAAYVSGGQTRSAYQKDELLVRALSETDIETRYQDAVQIVDGIAWGA